LQGRNCFYIPKFPRGKWYIRQKWTYKIQYM
jgi:hypothetical protein